MSATAIWTVHCSSCGHWRYEAETRADAERTARRAGWRVQTPAQGGENTCPTCLAGESDD